MIVNRVWQHLFGRGIVTTVDNFGVTGDKPSHPELLDHLANRFIRDGWSVKKLVRAIVLTRAYQLGCGRPGQPPCHRPGQPARLAARPRRLDAEEIRDAMLAAAGTLDLRRPEASPVKALRMVEMRGQRPGGQRHPRASRQEHVPQRLLAAAPRGDPARAGGIRSGRADARHRPTGRDHGARPGALLAQLAVRPAAIPRSGRAPARAEGRSRTRCGFRRHTGSPSAVSPPPRRSANVPG